MITENRKLIKIMTFIPPLLGVVFFSFIVKYTKNPLVNDRLPIYQGVSAYFSLLLIGFTYIKSRSSIYGKTMIYLILAIVLIPFLGYSFVNLDKIVVTIFISVNFLCMSILYLLLIRGKIFYYLLFSTVNSVLLTLFLIINYYLAFFIIVILLLFLLFLINNMKDDLKYFSIKEEGKDVMKSIFIHSPFIFLPFFDFLVKKYLGNTDYSNYVVYNKFINGGITLLFSYKQLNLMFSSELKNKKMITVLLFFLCVTAGILVFFNNNYVFIVMLALLSLGVNFSSLIIRNLLLNGLDFYFSFISLFFVLVYVLLFYTLKSVISNHPQVFILLMILSTILPSLFIISFNKIKKI